MAIRGVICPVCNENLKHWKSKMCMSCLNKSKVKNSDSRFMRAKKANPLYEKKICPVCNSNHMSKNSKMCLECLRKEQRIGRIGIQRCTDCGCELTDQNWPNHRKKWWHRVCDTCFANRKSGQDSTVQNRKATERTFQIKRETMDAYGGKCACCGEPEIAFLTIDHKLENGKTHVFVSKNGKTHRLNGSLLYKWLKDNGYPQDDFQCLCMNCNFAKSKNPGGCPHQLTENQLSMRSEVSAAYQHICEFCGKKLRNNGGLASHKRKYHSDEIDRQRLIQAESVV